MNTELEDLMDKIRPDMPEVARAIELLSTRTSYTATSASLTRPDLRFVTPNGSSLQFRGDEISTPAAQVVHRALPDQPASFYGQRAIINYQVDARLLHGIIVQASSTDSYLVLPLKGVQLSVPDGYSELSYYGDYIAKVMQDPAKYQSEAVRAKFFQPWNHPVTLTVGSGVVLAEYRHSKITTGLTGDGTAGKRVTSESFLGAEYFILQVCCCNCEEEDPPPPPPPPPPS